MRTFHPTPQREACALVACIPGALDREPYVQQIAQRAGYDPAIVRREVETIASTGQAVSIYGQLREGGKASTHEIAKPAAETSELQGWWNLPQGEGEDLLDFHYRTGCRLDIARDVIEWGQFFEWWGRTAALSEERGIGIFDAERIAYREVREIVSRDPLWSGLRAVIAGEIAALEEQLYPANDLTVAVLFSDLIDLMQARGMDWFDEFQERLGAGQDEEGALRSVLRMAGKEHGNRTSVSTT